MMRLVVTGGMVTTRRQEAGDRRQGWTEGPRRSPQALKIINRFDSFPATCLLLPVSSPLPQVRDELDLDSHTTR